MPPEQADGRHELHDQRSDVYALGAILYEILTGVIPFDAPNTEALLEKVCHEPPPLPRARQRGVRAGEGGPSVGAGVRLDPVGLEPVIQAQIQTPPLKESVEPGARFG